MKEQTELTATRIGLKVIEWEDTSSGPALFVECPALDEHTNPDGHRDACIYPGPPPTLHCVHNSCANSIKRVNQAMRSAHSSPPRNGMKGRQSKSQSKQKRNQELAPSQAAAELLEAAKSTKWTISDLAHSSPSVIPSDPMEQFLSHLELFRPYRDQGHIWSGFHYQSGKKEHRDNFRSYDSWLEFYKRCQAANALPMPFPLITPGIFKRNVESRADKNVIIQPWLVMEHDDLEKQEQLALAKFIENSFKLRLRAVVDTRGKSFHFWFDRPHPPQMKPILKLLNAWGFDPSAHKGIAQPMRVAGTFRPPSNDPLDYDSQLQYNPEFIQRLLYLDSND